MSTVFLFNALRQESVLSWKTHDVLLATFTAVEKKKDSTLSASDFLILTVRALRMNSLKLSPSCTFQLNHCWRRSHHYTIISFLWLRFTSDSIWGLFQTGSFSRFCKFSFSRKHFWRKRRFSFSFRGWASFVFTFRMCRHQHMRKKHYREENFALFCKILVDKLSVIHEWLVYVCADLCGFWQTQNYLKRNLQRNSTFDSCLLHPLVFIMKTHFRF